jgi:hypothetical protein
VLTVRAVAGPAVAPGRLAHVRDRRAQIGRVLGDDDRHDGVRTGPVLGEDRPAGG